MQLYKRKFRLVVAVRSMSLEYINFVEREQLPQFENEVDGVERAKLHLDYINELRKRWDLTSNDRKYLDQQYKVFQDRVDNARLDKARLDKATSSGGSRRRRTKKYYKKSRKCRKCRKCKRH